MDPTLDTSSLFQSVPFPQMPGMAPRGGMFGGGKDWRSALLAAVAGFMSRRSPGVAGNIINGLQDAQTLKQRIALAQQDRQQQFQDARLAHQQDRQFDIANPLPQQPDQTERLLARYLDPTTPAQEKDAIGQILMPPTLQMVNGSLVSVPRTPPQMPTAPVGKLTPYNPGGPSPSGSDSFPYQ